MQLVVILRDMIRVQLVQMNGNPMLVEAGNIVEKHCPVLDLFWIMSVRVAPEQVCFTLTFYKGKVLPATPRNCHPLHEILSQKGALQKAVIFNPTIPFKII